MIEVAAGTALSPHVERDAMERSSEAVYVSKIHRKVSEIPCYQCVNQRPLLSFYNDRASSNDGTFMLTQELSPSLACVVGGAQISRVRSRRGVRGQQIVWCRCLAGSLKLARFWRCGDSAG